MACYDCSTPTGLINTKALRRLASREKLDLGRCPVHAKWIRRMMFLEARLGGRTRDELRRDPLYSRYLAKENFDILFDASAAAGEAI